MAQLPNLLIEPDDVTDRALVPGDPDRVERIAAQCEESTVVAHNREYKIVNATYSGTPLTIASTGVGSPSAAVAIEELSRAGVNRFIRVGTAGGLQEEVKIGDLVVATAAAKFEGTSKRYESAEIPAVPQYELLDSISTRATSTDRPVHRGPIVTDDAFYAETDEYVEDWESANLLAVEMEAAALFTLGRRRGLETGAIVSIDGNLVAGTQKGEGDHEEELPEAADQAVGDAINIALDAIVEG